MQTLLDLSLRVAGCAYQWYMLSRNIGAKPETLAVTCAIVLLCANMQTVWTLGPNSSVHQCFYAPCCSDGFLSPLLKLLHQLAKFLFCSCLSPLCNGGGAVLGPPATAWAVGAPTCAISLQHQRAALPFAIASVRFVIL